MVRLAMRLPQVAALAGRPAANEFIDK